MSNPESLTTYLQRVVYRRDLTEQEAQDAMRAMLAGAPAVQIAGLLAALHVKGETAEELAGFARALREAAVCVPYECPRGETLLDTCGTGGDGHNTFNISTTVAFVVAGAGGVRVAKHGNRGVSSRSGSADVLECLGVSIAATGEQAAEALAAAGVCFLFAPAFHPRTREIQAIRRELKIRTAFNLLGPLCNPARTRAQIVGTPSLNAAKIVAGALATLGLERGYVVHGDDGLDELTTTAPSTVFEICEGRVEESRLTPEDLGIQRVGIEELRGGSPEENAAITRDVLGGKAGPRRDIVLANAALALIAAGRAASIDEAMRAAADSIDSGAAQRALDRLAAIVPA